MKNASAVSLRRRRQQLIRALPPIEQIIRGSLIETYKRCGRANCHCADGSGHGPKRYLSTVARTGERARLGYVPNATYPQVAEFGGHVRHGATDVDEGIGNDGVADPAVHGTCRPCGTLWTSFWSLRLRSQIGRAHV